jgi:hypothetical protein
VGTSSRIALLLAWLTLSTTLVLAWRKILSQPDGDINALVVASLAGPLGLGLLGDWLRDRESRPSPNDAARQWLGAADPDV